MLILNQCSVFYALEWGIEDRLCFSLNLSNQIWIQKKQTCISKIQGLGNVIASCVPNEVLADSTEFMVKIDDLKFQKNESDINSRNQSLLNGWIGKINITNFYNTLHIDLKKQKDNANVTPMSEIDATLIKSFAKIDYAMQTFSSGLVCEILTKLNKVPVTKKVPFAQHLLKNLTLKSCSCKEFNHQEMVAKHTICGMFYLVDKITVHFKDLPGLVLHENVSLAEIYRIILYIFISIIVTATFCQRRYNLRLYKDRDFYCEKPTIGKKSTADYMSPSESISISNSNSNSKLSPSFWNHHSPNNLKNTAKRLNFVSSDIKKDDFSDDDLEHDLDHDIFDSYSEGRLSADPSDRLRFFQPWNRTSKGRLSRIRVDDSIFDSSN